LEASFVSSPPTASTSRGFIDILSPGMVSCQILLSIQVSSNLHLCARYSSKGVWTLTFSILKMAPWRYLLCPLWWQESGSPKSDW
jgi:hypothetical protein